MPRRPSADPLFGIIRLWAVRKLFIHTHTQTAVTQSVIQSVWSYTNTRGFYGFFLVAYLKPKYYKIWLILTQFHLIFTKKQKSFKGKIHSNFCCIFGQKRAPHAHFSLQPLSRSCTRAYMHTHIRLELKCLYFCRIISVFLSVIIQYDVIFSFFFPVRISGKSYGYILVFYKNSWMLFFFKKQTNNHNNSSKVL